MPFDWTAAAFGVLVTAVGGLLAAVAAFLRRELDHHRDRLAAFESRLHAVEAAQFLLSPVAKQMERKMDEEAKRMNP